jgi:non-ribosomal peptide synthetase component F
MLDLTASDRVLELSSTARDAHLLTVFATLLRGATLTLSAREANVLSAPVARFVELRREQDLSALSTVILYGDSMSPRLLDSLPGKRFVHVRELPNATLFQLSHEYNQTEQWPTLIPYERGSQVEFYVLDKAFQPVPMGVTGELFIAVNNRQWGYAANADLTAATFVPNPFSSEGGSRLYASGFQVRLDADGSLQYLGNSQEQVEVGSYHVSLKEIEAVVTQHSAVLHTLIRVDDEGEKSVIAYVVPDETATTPPALSDLQNVADYLRPAAYVVLDQLPLSVEGEVELTALPKAEVKTVTDEYVAPQSPLEVILARIWTEVLEVEKISVHDNFFNLGGHSLLATIANLQVSDAFGIEVPVTVLFEAPTIAELANKLLQDPNDGQRIGEIAALQISMEEMANKVKALVGKDQAPEEKQVAPEKPAAKETSSSPIRPVPRDGDLPLSFAQQQLWVFDQMAPGSPVYNVPLGSRLRQQALDIAVLQRTFNEIVRRHESLRTTFPEENGQPRQVISPPAPAPLYIVDLSFLSKEVREREARHLVQQEAQRPFDLANGPLIRTGLLKLDEQDHIVLLTMHHIVSDGWSMGVLLNEITTLYDAFSRGEPSPLPEPLLQYADYAVWQREWLQGEVLEKQVSYWRQQLEGAPALLELPTDKPRPAIQTFRGMNEAVALSAELTVKLNELSRQHNVTLFMLLLAAFQLLLHRYTGQKDIVVASPIAGRTRPGTESLIGYLINTLALRGRFTRELTFEELLRQVREVTLGAYEHQELPFENLVGQLQPERNLSYTPLVQVLFVLQNLPQTRGKAATSGAADVADAPSTATDNSAEPPPQLVLGTTKFDITLWLRESGGAINGAVEYNTDLFSAQRVLRFIGHYKQLLNAIVNNPQQRVSELPLLTETEQQLLQDFNDTAPALPQDLYAHQLFEAQVARTPEAVALVHEDEQLSYAELNGRANQLAHYLRGNGV